jgi:excisionase family DNA binding protein
MKLTPNVQASSSASSTSSPAAPAPAAAAPAYSSELLTPEQLALRLNVSRRCLGNWTRERLIPMVKIGRVCRFDLGQVMAALEKHVQGVATTR